MNEIIAIAKRIAKVRKENGFSQAELANKTGINRGSVSAIEDGRQKPPIDFLARFVKTCNTTYDYIVEGKEDERHSMAFETMDSLREKVKILQGQIDVLHEVIQNLTKSRVTGTQNMDEFKDYIGKMMVNQNEIKQEQ